MNCYLKVDKRKIYTELLINPIEKSPSLHGLFFMGDLYRVKLGHRRI
ncbi:hypothetical protein ACIN8IBEIGE_50161 [Acinetobacter sp. 8I-beige]|nr:hypothetical protein ACIN8IBEIGE_50161 [Acinetobacter sp. 8I-beige]